MTENQSQPLSTQRVEQTDMDKPDTAHIAGFFDAAGTISGHIVKGGATIGYRFEPMVRITRPAEDSYIFGKILETALEQFGEWRGTTTRFTELGGGVFSDVTQDVMAEHPAVQAITEILSEQDVSPVTLPEIVHEFYARDSDAATALFIRNGVSLPDDASERANRLFDPEVYQAQFAFQFKTMLYHAGILTESGSDSTHLAPQTDMWELEPDFGGDL